MPEPQKHVPLRTVGDIISAQEQVYNAIQNGSLDSKTADALNTTLKGATYLLAKLRLDVAKLLVQAKIKKIELPSKMLPEL